MTREELEIKLKEFKEKYFPFDEHLLYKDFRLINNIVDDFYYTFNDIEVWDIISTESFKCRLIGVFNTEIHIALSNSNITFYIKI